MLKTDHKQSIEERFQFSETSASKGGNLANGRLCSVTGIEDGEPYSLRLYQKVGTSIDDDLRRLLTGSIRRIRRVLASSNARENLVEVLEVVEDENEIGVQMADAGLPLSGLLTRLRSDQKSSYLTNTGRILFWRNLIRIAEGLICCHKAGIVHGNLNENVIFTFGESEPDFRLGGYEACIHIASPDVSASNQDFEISGPISFQRDWIDLGKTVQSVLGIKSENGPILTIYEKKILNRLLNPPRFEKYDGSIIIQELNEVVEELERIGASSEGELILFPSKRAISQDFSLLTSGAIPAEDTEALLKFVQKDLQSEHTRVVLSSQKNKLIKLVTDIAVYLIKPAEDKIGVILKCEKRKPDDPVHSTINMSQRIRLCENLHVAQDRCRVSGNGALRLDLVSQIKSTSLIENEQPVWYALLLLEVFTILREQFDIYPVETVPLERTEGSGVIGLVIREDIEKDHKRQLLGMKTVSDELRRQLTFDIGRPDWTVSDHDLLSPSGQRLPELAYDGLQKVQGKNVYVFRCSEPVAPGKHCFLRPIPNKGAKNVIDRRIRNIIAARDNIALLRSLDDPAIVAMDYVLNDVATTGDVPEDLDLDLSKKDAWEAITKGRSINIVVGPPGVGKTFLITNLIKNILSQTPDARILVSAQSHDTLVNIEDELQKKLLSDNRIVARVEKSQKDEDKSLLRQYSKDLLHKLSDNNNDVLLASQHHRINQALIVKDNENTALVDQILRDTDSLILRSADVTLATTNSFAIEEMIKDGDQFDWVFIEEAARVNGSELIGPLLLGNRRVMIGDHNQLSPFDIQVRSEFYDIEKAKVLLTNAQRELKAIKDLPKEVDQMLINLTEKEKLLVDVLATAQRLEQPFKSIAEKEEERTRDNQKYKPVSNTLLEQSRMHPAICDLVSNVFYSGDLKSSNRVKNRSSLITSMEEFPDTPITVLNFPPLSNLRKISFEERVSTSLKNLSETNAVWNALGKLKPNVDSDEIPSLAILSPYTAQVKHFEQRVNTEFKNEGLLFGFNPPRNDGRFVFSVDSFQGGEADLVFVSLVRNNVRTGSGAFGFLQNRQRMNVLLSRAKHKLVLVTSLQFISEAVDGPDPDQLGTGKLGFLRTLVHEIERLSTTTLENGKPAASIINVDEQGEIRQ